MINSGDIVNNRLTFILSNYWGRGLHLSPSLPFFNTAHLREVQIALGEGNGTPLQYSCLENRMDGGAW